MSELFEFLTMLLQEDIDNMKRDIAKWGEEIPNPIEYATRLNTALGLNAAGFHQPMAKLLVELAPQRAPSI